MQFKNFSTYYLKENIVAIDFTYNIRILSLKLVLEIWILNFNLN